MNLAACKSYVRVLCVPRVQLQSLFVVITNLKAEIERRREVTASKVVSEFINLVPGCQCNGVTC